MKSTPKNSAAACSFVSLIAILYTAQLTAAEKKAGEAEQSKQSVPAIDAEDGDNLTRLMHAAARGDIALVKSLLNKNADPNRRNSTDGLTALMFASYHGHREVVKTLSECGGKIELKDSQDNGAIDWAATGGQKEIVQFYKDRGQTLKPAVGGASGSLAVGGVPVDLVKKAAGKEERKKS